MPAPNDLKSPVLGVEELTRLLSGEFPEMFTSKGGLTIEAVWHGGCRMRRTFHQRSLRPGGTISGPTMMALADVAMYVGLLASIGWVPLAVTTHLAINFLRKPQPRDLIAEAKLLKLGKRLAVGEISMWSDGEDALLAHATSTYSIPGR